MKAGKLIAGLAGLLLAGVLAGPMLGRQRAEGIPATGWQIPVDVGGAATDADWIRLGWDSFVALNWPSNSPWPAPGRGGEPDKTISITSRAAASRPVVWQTYLAPGQVFRENGLDPGTWDRPALAFTSTKDPSDPKKLLPVLGGFEEKSIYFLTQNPDFGLALYDLATTPNPVVDQLGNYVLLEVRLNQSELEYFRGTGYYDSRRQIEDTENGKFVFLPATGTAGLPDWARQGAIEIKASWRILDKERDIFERYFTTRAAYLKPDGTVSEPVTLGLVGLHILRNTPKSKSTWFWTTFEQVDNVKIKERPVPRRPDGTPLSPSFNPGPAGREPVYPFGFDTAGRFDYALLSNPEVYYNPVTEPAMLSQGDVIPRNPPDRPVNCSRVAPIRQAVQRANAQYQAKLRGTVWQYYEMIDVLYPDPNGISEVLNTNDAHWEPKLLVNTPALVNTTMESYLAYKYSSWSLDTCQSCHYSAKPQMAEGNKAVPPQVFSYLYRRATASR
jgi:hypothetical protein